MLSREQLSELIAAVYDAALDPKLWSTFVHTAQRAFQSHSASLMFVDQQNPSTSIAQLYGTLESITPEYQERISEDYWVQGSHRMNPGDVVVGTDLIGLIEIHRTDFYNDMGVPNDVEYILAAKVHKGAGSEAIASFIRGKQFGNFTDLDKEAFQMLVPHLRKAHFIHTQLSAGQALGDALNQSSRGVVVLDSAGRALFINETAERYFREGDGISLRFGIPTLSDSKAQMNMDCLISTAQETALGLGTASGGIMRVHRPSGKLPYQIVVSPLNACSDQITLMPGASCLLFVHDPTVTPDVSKDTLKGSYGLTDAEAQLCAGLYAGSTLAEAADIQKVTLNTAKTHLKSIFTKCRVSSQVALVRLLALGPK